MRRDESGFLHFGQLWEITDSTDAWNRVNDRVLNTVLGTEAALSLIKKDESERTSWEKHIEDEKLDLIARLYVLVALMKKSGHTKTAVWIQELLDTIVLADLTDRGVRDAIITKHNQLNPWQYNRGRWPENYPED